MNISLSINLLCVPDSLCFNIFFLTHFYSFIAFVFLIAISIFASLYVLYNHLSIYLPTKDSPKRQFKGELQGRNKLVSAVWYTFEELVFVIIFGEPDLEMGIFCPTHKQNWNSKKSSNVQFKKQKQALFLTFAQNRSIIISRALFISYSIRHYNCNGDSIDELILSLGCLWLHGPLGS